MEMIKHTGNYPQFKAAIETKMVDFEPVAHLDTIGATWYLFHGPGLLGYTAATQGDAGGDRWDDTRDPRRVIEFWTTPEVALGDRRGITQLDAWKLAVAFITAQVEADLTAEWTEGVPVLSEGAQS